MELRELFILISNKRRIVFLVSVLFCIVGIIIYYTVPPKFTATGSFFIRRTVEEPSQDFFSYEGYYAQQAALSYSNTLSALFESVDIRSKAMTNLKVPVNDQTLRKYGRQIKVKNAGPQLVTLTVKDVTASDAVNLWAALTNATLETTTGLNTEGDSSISVAPVVEEPIVQMTFSNVYVNAVAGLIIGFVISIFSLSFAQYIRGEE